MANLKSSKKDIRRTKKRTALNIRLKNRIKRAKRSIDEAITAGEKKTVATTLAQFQKINDKAVKRGLIKKKTASRRKSRYAKKIKNLTARDAKTNKPNNS